MAVKNVGKLWNAELWTDDQQVWETVYGRDEADDAGLALISRIADVMTSVECHDLRVVKLEVVKHPGGHSILAVAEDFFSGVGGMAVNAVSSTPCPGCGGFVDSSNRDTHDLGCPFVVVRDVMTV